MLNKDPFVQKGHEREKKYSETPFFSLKLDSFKTDLFELSNLKPRFACFCEEYLKISFRRLQASLHESLQATETRFKDLKNMKNLSRLFYREKKTSSNKLRH